MQMHVALTNEKAVLEEQQTAGKWQTSERVKHLCAKLILCSQSPTHLISGETF